MTFKVDDKVVVNIEDSEIHGKVGTVLAVDSETFPIINFIIIGFDEPDSKGNKAIELIDTCVNLWLG